jgi:uncharacterized membrane protein YgcG
MHNRIRWAACAALLTGLWAWNAALAAVAPEVRDDAKMFSPAALKKADEGIRKIFVDHDRDLLIETFASVPTEELEKVKAMDKSEKTTYFTRWAKERVSQRAVNGVYVLICKEPRFVRAGVVEKMPHQFPKGFNEVVEETLIKEFKDGHFDEGLDHVVRLVQDKLEKQGK